MDRILDLDLAAARETEVPLDEETQGLLAERRAGAEGAGFQAGRRNPRHSCAIAGIEIQDGPKGSKGTLCRWSKGRKRL